MTDDRAVRMALEHAALVAAVRAYVELHEHQIPGGWTCQCLLCEALAKIDRPKP